MHMQKRILAICVLLLSLACIHYRSQAQEPALSWQVMAIAMSDNGRYLAVRTGVRGTELPNTAYEIWVYDLENLLLPPQFLAGDIAPNAKIIFSPNNRYLAVGSFSRVVNLRHRGGR